MFMNEAEIDNFKDMVERLDHRKDLAVAKQAAKILSNFRHLVNNKSDGWPYWRLPQKAVAKLVDLVLAIQDKLRNGQPITESEADLKKALTPIKAFCTRHKFNYGEVTG